jgi:hypothetical protein
MKHSDAAEDRKMMKSYVPKKKIAKHLASDIKEQAHGIKKDVKMMKSMKKGCK